MRRRFWIVSLIILNVIIAAGGAMTWWKLLGEWDAANAELNQEIERSGWR